MKRCKDLTPGEYADLIRRIVDWLSTQERYRTYRQIARRYRLTLDEVEDVVGDSEVYGPTIMPHALRSGTRGDTTVEILR
jgi:hypothetical protein